MGEPELFQEEGGLLRALKSWCVHWTVIWSPNVQELISLFLMIFYSHASFSLAP